LAPDQADQQDGARRRIAFPQDRRKISARIGQPDERTDLHMGGESGLYGHGRVIEPAYSAIAGQV
jgi:hypothetical protein